MTSLTDETDRYVSTILVGEPVLIALTYRNSFMLFKAGKKTLVMERRVTTTFEVNRNRGLLRFFPSDPTVRGRMGYHGDTFHP